MKILFLDESSSHNLSVIDPQYPVFVLGGVIVDEAYAEGELTDSIQQIKYPAASRRGIRKAVLPSLVWVIGHHDCLRDAG